MPACRRVAAAPLPSHAAGSAQRSGAAAERLAGCGAAVAAAAAAVPAATVPGHYCATLLPLLCHRCRRRCPPDPRLLPCPCPCVRLPAAAYSQQMAKLYNNLGLKMMERRKHEEALGLVRQR